MARIDPKESFEALKTNVADSISSFFPFEGEKHIVELKDVEVTDNKGWEDIRDQKKAKMNNRTWGVPVHGTFVMKNKQTGNVLSEEKVKLATVPKITNRYSYIVGGTEFQVENLWRLKPGVYTRAKANGEVESHFNVKGRGFHLNFDPKSRSFNVRHGGAKPPLYPILKAMGVSDESMEKSWGKDIFDANKMKKADVEKKAIQFAKRLDKFAEVKDFSDASTLIKTRLKGMEMDPTANERTLGKGYNFISPDAVVATSNKLLGIAQGKDKPDDRDALMFKELLSVEDLIGERVKGQKDIISRRLSNNIDRKRSVKSVITPDLFGRPVTSLFGKSALANPSEQINPLEMLLGQQKTTILGEEGGITSAHRITEDAKLLNASHMGVLDPLQTPECHDDQTEVFTRRGWVLWPLVVDDDEFACNIQGELEFHRADKIVREHYEGVMYGAETKCLSYLVTPNHRMWCRSRDTCSPEASRWHFELAEEMRTRTRNVFTVHEAYIGSDFSAEFVLPHVVGDNSPKNFGSVPMSAWAAFLGWYLSEGSFVYDEEKSRYFVRIHQSDTANPGNCEDIAWVLDQFPFEWTYADRSFIIGVKQLAHYVRQFGKADDKFIPDYMFEASTSDREELLAALLLGDGRLNSRRANGDTFHDIDVFTTTSARLADDVERLVISLGYASTRGVYEDKREDRYLDVHEVRILRRRERVVRKGLDHTAVEYDGDVYCATVPGGLLYTRRNGKTPFWSGNSDKTGVALNLAMGAKKIGRNVKIRLYDLKKNKSVMVTPEESFDSIVAFPDEVKWDGDTPVLPKKGKVAASLAGNELGKANVKDIRYVLRDPFQLFTAGSNLVPFLQNNSANRATMAGRQMEQAIPLKYREEPLVQTQIKGLPVSKHVGRLASSRSPVSGEVTKIAKDHIVVKGDDGKSQTVDIYDNYPLNDKKSFITSTPLVQVGDKVKQNQTIADSNFSKNGVYAPGVNLNTAYVPYKGLNYEDGVVISETAAKKLTSEHMSKKSLSSKDGFGFSKDKYRVYFPDRVSKEQSAKLDDDGVVLPGTTVQPGDTLLTGLAEQKLTNEQKKLRMMHKSLVKPYKDKAITWDEDKPGKVVEVQKKKTGAVVHVRTDEPVEIGDKIVSRHANKGICTAIIPDGEMPHTPDGKHVELLLNPISVPGRINLGQTLETAAGKIAEKRGKPYMVTNFDGKDHLTTIQNELAEEGLADTETLKDPVSGRDIPDVFVGKQYIHKLQHQVGKKMSARSRDAYDRNLIPRGGGPHGAQSLGALGTYAMLAHGATENLREFQTLKSDRSQGGDNDELWAALQAGEKLPPPKTPFAYDKFTGYLKTLGVDVEKVGNSLNLKPLTDKQVLAMSNGEIKDGGRMVTTKDMTPEKEGLFDEKITGGIGGNRWSHIKLREPMPNPIFRKAIMSLTGIRGPEFTALIEGNKGVTSAGEIVGPDHEDATYGPKSFSNLLGKINVNKDLETEEKRIGNLSGQNLNESNRRIKYLRALKKLDMKPTEAYMTKNVPVLPPVMRPLSVLDDGSLNFDDINQVYKHLALTNQKLGQVHRLAPDEEKNPLRAELYDNLTALAGDGGTLNRQYPGILDSIAGQSPKLGFVQDKLIKRKQDLSMRSTIIPDPDLSLDEVGIPRKAAMEMFKPFIVRDLKQAAGMSPLDAQKAIKDDSIIANKALDNVVRKRPVLLKRDPVLHKYGIQAFQPKLTSGRAIKIHPLITDGFNADFDGDSVHGKILVELPDDLCPGDEMLHDAGVSANFRSIEIADFPRLQETGRQTKKGLAFAVPDRVMVPAYKDGEVRMMPVTEFSIHPDCKEFVVRTRSGREVFCSSDHSLAVFDPESMEVVKAKPAGSVGFLVPTMRNLAGSCHEELKKFKGNDVVPVPGDVKTELLALLRGIEDTEKTSGRNDVVFSQYVVLNKSRGSITRMTAERLDSLLQLDEASDRVRQWKELVLDSNNLSWDIIESVEATGETVEMYDLTVPDAWTFTMANGIVVWDTMSAFVPISNEAVMEAEKMKPSNLLFSPSSGNVMYAPGKEMQVGLYLMSEKGKKTNKSFKDLNEMNKAYNRGELGMTDVVKMGGITTTLGRARIDSNLPKNMQGGEVLTNLDLELNKSQQKKIFSSMAKSNPKAYPRAVDAMKNLGNEYAYEGGFSFGLKDFSVHKDVRDAVFDEADKKAKSLDLKKEKDVEEFVNIYDNAMTKMRKEINRRRDVDKYKTRLTKLDKASGVKGDGLLQITGSPVLFVDSKGDVVTSPVRRSYSEGLNTSDYWANTSGGRKGIIYKVQSVREPGYLSKLVVNSTMNQVVDTDDCGSKKGVGLSPLEPDIIGRYTAAPVKVGRETIPSGTLVDTKVLDRIKNAKVNKVVVRSPMKCEHEKGLCAKCFGLDQDGKLPDKGTNVGVLASQALGEPTTQMAMKVFHSGGIYEGKKQGGVVGSSFDRAQDLLNLPQKVKGSAVLSSSSGNITGVEKDPAGGLNVKVGGQNHYIPHDRTMRPGLRSGAKVRKGDPLSDGPINPHEMLPLTGINKVQGQIASELHGIFGQQGVRRRNTELVVRALSSVTKVDDPGDNTDYVKGDFAPTAAVQAWNKKQKGTKPIIHQPVVRGVKQVPLDMQEDWLARLNHERLKETVIEGAQRAWTSDIHGTHPVPPLIYSAEFGKKKPY